MSDIKEEIERIRRTMSSEDFKEAEAYADRVSDKIDKINRKVVEVITEEFRGGKEMASF